LPGTDSQITVVVVDDHDTYRYALGAVISADGRLDLLGDAADGRLAIDLIRAERPDVALVDVMMGPVDGFEVCRSLSSSATGVILLSAYEDPELSERGRECGAAGYLSKGSTSEALCRAVVEVAGGGTCFQSG
jgi:two-component system nitrate/nitrite response regulator NarL